MNSFRDSRLVTCDQGTSPAKKLQNSVKYRISIWISLQNINEEIHITLWCMSFLNTSSFEKYTRNWKKYKKLKPVLKWCIKINFKLLKLYYCSVCTYTHIYLQRMHKNVSTKQRENLCHWRKSHYFNHKRWHLFKGKIYLPMY